MWLEPTPNRLLSRQAVVSGRGHRNGVLQALELDPDPRRLPEGHRIFDELPGHGPRRAPLRRSRRAPHPEQDREQRDDSSRQVCEGPAAALGVDAGRRGHGITSSARASADGGVISPSVFTVELCGLADRQVRRPLPFENTTGVTPTWQFRLVIGAPLGLEWSSPTLSECGLRGQALPPLALFFTLVPVWGHTLVALRPGSHDLPAL